MAYFIPRLMNWNRVIFVLAIIHSGLINDSVKAQTIETENYKKNEVSIELLGSGVQYSINYERSVYNKSRFDFKVKTGLTFNPFTPFFTLDLNEKGDEYGNNSFIPFGGIEYGWKF